VAAACRSFFSPHRSGRYHQKTDFGLVDSVAPFIDGIRHWLDDRKWCGHDWNYWRDMLPYYLSKI
jgi:esterase/lipase superfamily enzyme